GASSFPRRFPWARDALAPEALPRSDVVPRQLPRSPYELLVSRRFPGPSTRSKLVDDVTWQGLFPSIPTPFTSEGAVDLDAQRQLVRFAVDHGAHGIICFG